jgi:hypothetical protein
MMIQRLKKLRKPLVIVLSLWFCFLITMNMALTSQKQLSPSGVARVYGHAWYIKDNGEPGFSRRARVELWEDALIDRRLAISQTDDTGYYEFNIAMTGSKNVYAEVFCESYIVSVTYGIFDTVYSYTTPTKTAYEGSATYLGTYYAPPEDLHWKIMDSVTDEFLWIQGRVNWVRSQVQVKYPEGNKPVSYGDVIELPNPNTYPWKRTDVLHEYAHCVMYALYGHFPQGSCSDSCQCPQGKHYFNSVKVVTPLRVYVVILRKH